MKFSRLLEIIAMIVFILFIVITVSITFFHCFTVLQKINEPLHETYCCNEETIHKLELLQQKIFDDTSITFATTLIVSVLITSGIYLLNRNNDALDKYKNLLGESTKKIQSIYKINDVYPSVISIYLFSCSANHSILGNNHETYASFYSICSDIDRHIKIVDPLLRDMSIDDRNKKLLRFYIGETINNLTGDPDASGLYVNAIVGKLKELKERVEKFEIINISNFQILQ